MAPVLFTQHGHLGRIILNRPEALNALSLEMIDLINATLDIWAHDSTIRQVAITASGNRAFCAGGDVRAAWQAVRHDRDNGGVIRGKGDGGDFFRHEYRLNHRIREFYTATAKPFIAIIDGIVMGGGCGLSMHASHRIGTEKTLLAMPETAIGLFPDVGMSHILSRLPNYIGLCLGLTGHRLQADDLAALGLIDRVIASEQTESLLENLATRHITDIDFPPIHIPPATLINHANIITECFGQKTLADILTALQTHPDNPLLASFLTAMQTASPTSLKLTHALFERSREIDFAQALKIEYRLSQSCLAGHDFFEGVRARLIDKDNTPRWNPANLADVDNALIESHFAPLGTLELEL